MLRGFSPASGEGVCEIPMGNSSVVTTYWDAGINQIFVGMFDGKIKVLYHPELSKGGILRCISK